MKNDKIRMQILISVTLLLIYNPITKMILDDLFLVFLYPYNPNLFSSLEYILTFLICIISFIGLFLSTYFIFKYLILSIKNNI